jgi:hypothetical protein
MVARVVACHAAQRRPFRAAERRVVAKSYPAAHEPALAFAGRKEATSATLIICGGMDPGYLVGLCHIAAVRRFFRPGGAQLSSPVQPPGEIVTRIP